MLGVYNLSGSDAPKSVTRVFKTEEAGLVSARFEAVINLLKRIEPLAEQDRCLKAFQEFMAEWNRNEWNPEVLPKERAIWSKEFETIHFSMDDSPFVFLIHFKKKVLSLSKGTERVFSVDSRGLHCIKWIPTDEITTLQTDKQIFETLLEIAETAKKVSEAKGTEMVYFR
jgi:hypothetical protein